MIKIMIRYIDRWYVAICDSQTVRVRSEEIRPFPNFPSEIRNSYHLSGIWGNPLALFWRFVSISLIRLIALLLMICIIVIWQQSLSNAEHQTQKISTVLSLAIVTGRIRKYTRNTNNLSYFREISISTVHTCPEVTQQIEILKQYSPEETQQMHRADILANLRKHRKMDESGLECN